jgi:Domain of unknown function (DU1801)
MARTDGLSTRIAEVPAAVRPIVEAAIKTIRAAAPSAQEIPYDMAAPRSKSMVWKLVRFAAAGQNVVGVGTLTRHSMIFFYRGRELDDGSGLLEGGGKEMRYIKLTSPADAGRPEVRKMVKRAFQLGA